MDNKKKYDIAIAGGGLAGLCLAIQSVRKGHTVILFEKEKYPYHKVCGEYISFECWNFLEEIGIPLSNMNLPHISNLLITSPSGKEINQRLPLGGFGISRYTIDSMLADIAKKEGVIIMEDTKAEDINFINESFIFHTTSGLFQSSVAAGAFGKRSNLDTKWSRKFLNRKKNKLNNYIGVKYHIKTNWPENLIALHNFENGYCGISKVESEKYCLCYLTTASNLKKSGNSIKEMEKSILSKNLHLKKLFATSEIIYKEPLTIAQVSFNKKTQIENHILMLGDAAGMIAPLCGNGMSMAMHSSKIAAGCIDQFLNKKISRQQMELQYISFWKQTFGKRVKTGRFVQQMFGKSLLTNIFISILKPFPRIVQYIIRKTHGEPF